DLSKVVLNKIIRNLQADTSLIKPAVERQVNARRAWNRYLLAYSYYTLFQKSNDPLLLEKAAFFSPDLTDKLNDTDYFYDAVLLKSDILGFKMKYVNYLSSHRKLTEALKVLTDLAFADPSNENINTLRSYYLSMNKQ